ncbi:DUF2889 domain-containing protein [Emcibacteraceae bacterium]|jgi:hypothetical protein|nr:DUF2889 domain-containing protein [Emcibacteraceae bacterium]
MPLSKSQPRKLIHTRSIKLKGFNRDDGLWDIEAHMTDIKSYDVENKWRNGIAAGDPIHEMWIRLTVDDNFLISAVEAVTDNSPFEMCPIITKSYQELVGIRIGRGWRRAINEKVKGRKGCTHITELLQPLATVSFQTLMGNIQNKINKKNEQGRFLKPIVLNSCHAWAEDSEIVKAHLPDHYKGA